MILQNDLQLTKRRAKFIPHIFSYEQKQNGILWGYGRLGNPAIADHIITSDELARSDFFCIPRNKKLMHGTHLGTFRGD